MNIRVISDSSSNIFEMKELDYMTVPLKIIFNGLEYADIPGLDAFALMHQIHASKGVSSTSCPNVHEWKEAMELRPADAIFCITISSNLSGGYAAACTAADEYRQEHPETPVVVFDSKSTGPEMELYLEKLIAKLRDGASFEAAVSAIQKYQEHLHIQFALESLVNLSRAGRVSSAIAFIAGIIGFRFLGEGSEEGTIHMLDKYRGEKKTLQHMLQFMKRDGFAGGRLRISHCDNLRGAELFRDMVLQLYPGTDVSINACTGLCSYYADLGGIIIAYEDAGA